MKAVKNLNSRNWLEIKDKNVSLIVPQALYFGGLKSKIEPSTTCKSRYGILIAEKLMRLFLNGNDMLIKMT